MTPKFLFDTFKSYCLFLIQQELAHLEKQIALTKEVEKFVQSIEIPK